ncbi:hypothetical protein CspeluHIS016_0206050 [Cutaneotrichosporon spelunceum]|uniref:Large ribosomal subunit protein mL46 n=1 Tax=Cutaneotrichosporon spelunceum TaxID=1672016 RepID=A0AAD3TRZ3_9TREE|nr:hypothetical protein CspeluHIS016_0206050 [Cutaneotrichosporon spelunceum]
MFASSRSGPSRQVLSRGLATATTKPPPITASVLLSRHALLTPTPKPFAKAYYDYQSKLRHALSNPVPTDFYFKPGSLALRRFLESEHAVEEKYYGAKVAGPKPELGEVQPEPPIEEKSRDHWEKEDEARGDRSLERFPEEEVFCLVQSKGKWTFPGTSLQPGEGLDEAVTARVTGVKGQLNGNGMDTWLVSRKPVGLVSNDKERNFFLRSHILAGEPQPTKESGYSNWAWLTRDEVEERLRKQGDDKLWESVKGMFGVGSQEE